jgi:hypothetical protein
VSTALRARVAAYSRRRGFGSIRDLASAKGFAVSVISKMWSGLSIRGTTCRWWRKAGTVAAVSPRAPWFLSAARSESNRLRCEGGDTPWLQESGLSRSTRPV